METPEFYPPVSIIVSHILDNIGVNEEIIKKRRNIYLQNEAIRAITYNLSANYTDKTTRGVLSFKSFKVYEFGSQIEGATTKGLCSDKDILYALNSKDFEMTTNMLDSVQENTPKGHYRLPHYDQHWYYTKSGSSFLPNFVFSQELTMHRDSYYVRFKHGPSMYSIRGKDNVPALKLQTWPASYRLMLKRFRVMVWPSNKLLNQITNTDIFLTPAGYADSEFSFLEWRISPSLAERMLIFSFNITQMRCLTLLKLIKKHFFEPEVGDCFTSYHCKTVMFYTMARTPSSLWKNDNLMRCITSCLSTLHMFLKYRFCPQFLNPDLNLFVGKLNSEAYRIVIKIVRKFLKSNLRCLLQIKCDMFGEQLRVIVEMMFNPLFNAGLRNILNRNDKKEIIVNIIMERIHNHALLSDLIFRDMNSFTLKKICRATINILRALLTIIKSGDNTDRQATKSFLPFICTNLASFLSSYRIKKKQPITQDILDFYRIGFQTDDISARLKLASALVCANQYDEALTVIKEARSVYSTKSKQICHYNASLVLFDMKQFYKYAFEWLDKDQCMMAFTRCVQFHRQEIWCCPLGFRWSVLEATCDSKRLIKLQEKQLIQIQTPTQDINRMNIQGSDIDSCVLLCYLEFLIYRHFKEADKVKQSLDNLIKYLNPNPLEWEKYFIDLVPKETDDLVLEYNKLILCYQGKELDNYYMAINPEINKRIKYNPFGIIGICVINAFQKFSRILHNGVPLTVVGYALETMGHTRTAYAFYWIAYLVYPSIAAHRHLLRLHLFRKPFQHILFSCHARDIKRKQEAELCLLSHLSYSFMMMLDKCERVQEKADISDSETNRQKAIRFCIYFAMLIRNYKKLPKSAEEYSPSLLLIGSNNKILLAHSVAFLLEDKMKMAI